MVNFDYNTRLCYATNIDTSHALRGDWVPPDTRIARVLNFKPLQIFQRAFLETLESRGIKTEWVLCFARPAGFNNKSAHIDVVGDARCDLRIESSAFNMVLGGADSEMRWYATPSGFEWQKQVLRTNTGVPYVHIPFTGLQPIASECLGSGLTLVRTDVPHAIFVGTEPRWCLSIRNSQSRVSWSETAKRMHELGIISV